MKRSKEENEAIRSLVVLLKDCPPEQFLVSAGAVIEQMSELDLSPYQLKMQLSLIAEAIQIHLGEKPNV